MDVRVLGPLQLVDGDRVVDLKGLRQRAVLAVLVIETGRVVSADRLADLVWDGEPPLQAPTSLQAYISKLRRAIEPHADGRARLWQHLRTQAPGYVFDIDLERIDAVRLELGADEGGRLLREGRPTDAMARLDEALALWQGDPYADFAFSAFARNEIARLHELRWRIIEDRAEASLALARHREAVAELDALVRSAPLRERLRGHLALALYRSGRQADALSTLNDARAVLLDELGLDPGPELRRLEQAILEQSPALDHRPPDESTISIVHSAPATSTAAAVLPSAPSDGTATGPARPPMVGRDGELARTVALIEQVRAGQGGLVLVTGEAGIGKTRLAEETAVRAQHLGMDVVWGRCPELEGAPPFWSFTQVLRALIATHPDLTVDPVLRALLPELGVSSATDASDGNLFQLYDATARFLDEAAARRPVLVVVEDLHWADAATLRLLRFLASIATPGAYAVLATSRDGDDATAVEALRAEAVRSSRADVVPLGHLDRRAVEQLLATLTGDAAGRSTVDALLARSGGNPFFLGELVRLGGAGMSGVPTGVRDVIVRRVGQLGERAQRLLAYVACCPDDAAIDALALALDEPLVLVADDIDEALAARLLHEVPDRVGRFRFSHPLVRDALLDGLSAVRRARLHLALADAMVASGVEPSTAPDEVVAELAHHYRHALAMGTAPAAIRWGVEAARRDLNRWAAEDAARRYELALELARTNDGIDESIIVDAMTGLGRALRFQGKGGSREVLKDAIRRARVAEDPERIVRAALSTAEGAWGLGTTFGTVDVDLVEALEWAIERLDVSRPDERVLHVAARAYLACELVFADDPDAAATMSASALADARSLADERSPGGARLLGGALVAHYATTWSPDTIGLRGELLDELASVVAREGYQRDRLLLLRWTASVERGDFASADAVLAEVEAAQAESPRPALLALLAWRRSLRAALDGHFEEAERLIFEAHDLSAALSPDEAVDATGGQLSLLYWLWGRLGTLVPLLRIALDEQPYLVHAFGPVLALALLEDGDRDAARALLVDFDLADSAVAPRVMLRAGTLSAFATACVELGDRELARVALRLLGDESLDVTAPTLVDHVGVFYLGSRGSYRGMLHLLLGELDPAIAALERGLALDEAAGAVVFVLRDKLHLADALRRRGNPGDAKRASSLVAEASAVARRLDLVVDLRRADQLVHELSAAPS